jgi:non-ribosomal peptide synthetase component E (peptide arylation enzyme)
MEVMTVSKLDFPRHKHEDAQEYSTMRWWLGITLGDMLDKTADLYPRKEAVVDDRVRLSY